MSKIREKSAIKIYQNASELFSKEAITSILNYAEGSAITSFFRGNLDLKTSLIQSVSYLGESLNKQNLERLDVLIEVSPSSSGSIKTESYHEEILQLLSDKPTGFILVDNALEKALILKPYTQKIKKYLDEKEVLSYFKKGGKIAGEKEDYEERPSQIIMTEESVDALNHDAFYLCEAPTGTGKSISYLMSGIFYTKTNQEKLIISTNTIALQEQLFLKDLPFVQKILPFDISYTLVKGKNNFLCKQRFELYKMNAPLAEDKTSIMILDKWAMETNSGDKSHLESTIPSEIWEEVNVDGSLCRPSKCPYKEECFYLKQKEKIATSDVLIANHHILCADASIKLETDDEKALSILPNYETLVIDEAHNLEEVASDYFMEATSNIAITRSINQIIRFEGKKITGGVLKEFFDMKEASFIHPAIDHLISQIQALNQYAGSYETIYHFLEQTYISKQKEKNIRIKNAFFKDARWKEACFSKLEILKNHLEKIITSLNQIKDSLENRGFKNTADYPMHRFEVYLFRLSSHEKALETFFDETLEETHVKAINAKQFNRQFFIAFQTSPLDISALLFEGLFSKLKRSIITSATLSDNTGFDFFKKRVGLDVAMNLRSNKLPSSFDFKKNVDFLIPEDIVDPSDPNYLDDLARYICSLAVLAQGKTLALFTSISQLESVFRLIESVLSSRGIVTLKQGETPKHVLLKNFTKAPSVLLGVNSFWEGIDLKGDLLKNVIITKLPFSVPTDPFYEAKTELLQKQGKNPFMTYSIPEAVIRFKQGFGRLIRSSTDTGVFCVLDKRILTKNYGEIFIKSLPEMPRINRLDQIKHLL